MSIDPSLLPVQDGGEWHISGSRNAILHHHLTDRSGAQILRRIKRMHLHSLTNMVAHTYKHYPSDISPKVVLTALKLHHLVVIPPWRYKCPFLREVLRDSYTI